MFLFDLSSARRSGFLGRCLLGACLLVAALTVADSAAGQSREATPSPRDGRFTVTVLALLGHSHGRCDDIGERLTSHWRKLSQKDPTAALEQFLLQRATEDLAAARQALDDVRQLLPGVARTADADVHRALDELFEAETELCNLVTRPSPPRSRFLDRLESTKIKIASIESRLGNMLAVPGEDELSRLLEPYLERIDRAGEVAREKVRRDLEAMRPPPPPPPTMTELMAGWHRGYQARVRTTKLALGQYVQGRRNNDARAIREACKTLLAEVVPILGEEDAFRAPDENVEEPLRKAYISLRNLAGHCTAGRFGDVDDSFRRAQFYLGEAAKVLGPYSLSP